MILHHILVPYHTWRPNNFVEESNSEMLKHFILLAAYFFFKLDFYYVCFFSLHLDWCGAYLDWHTLSIG